MKLLVSNVGSTSLKFKLFLMPEGTVICESRIERVGDLNDAVFTYSCAEKSVDLKRTGLSIPDYTAGIKLFVEYMTGAETGVIKCADEIERIGFKTVLAKDYYGVHELTEEVMDAMREALFVAPVHNAAYIEAIGQFKSVFPNAVMIGVFETAFHTTIPLERRIYAVPYEWVEKYGLMRMGYHGASHGYIARQAETYGKAGKIISCHLGGSCSICAIQDGKSVDTSFGYSLQTGIMHANRCGDADPYLIPFLESRKISKEEIMTGLSEKGGLLGLSGVSGDMRDIELAAEEGNRRAKLAIDAFVNNIVKYIGAFYAELGGLDQLVFTGGIGENSAKIRQAVCSAVKHMGIELDAEKNAHAASGVISASTSPVRVSVIPANEELGVAFQSYAYES